MKGDKEIYKKANGFDKRPENINKNGSPGKSVTKILKDLLNKNIAEIEITYTDIDGNEKSENIKLQSKGEFNTAIAIKLLQKCLSGDLQSIKELLDRTEGKAIQQVEVEQTNKVNLIIGSEIDNQLNMLSE